MSDMGKALERTSLPQSDRQALVRTLRECAGPANAVHQLLSKRVRGLWGRIMRDGRVPTDVNLVKAAGALVPRIEKVCPCSARGSLVLARALDPKRRTCFVSIAPASLACNC